jgi:hypothetical protein
MSSSMRLYLPLSLLLAGQLFVVNLNADPEPPPHSPTPPASAPKPDTLLLRTADGLPVEAEFRSLFHDKIKVRLTSSGREIRVPLALQDEALQKRLLENAREIRKTVTALPFNVSLLENATTKKEQPHPQVGLLGSAAKAPVRVLFPGGYCLRIKAQSPVGTDIPVEVNIDWYAKLPNRGAWSMAFQESITLNVDDDPAGEFFSTPPSFPRPTYQGYAMIAVNPLNNSILWKGANITTFLDDMEARLGLRKATPEKPAQKRKF